MSDESQYSEQAQQAQHLQYTPEPQEGAHAEAGVETATTQAIVFDPFVDGDGKQEPDIAAVAFDPFADDNNDDEGFDIAELLGRGDSSSSVTTHPDARTPGPSTASHRKALEDFHRRRSNAHRGRTVVNGMVRLSYITTQDPCDAVVNDEKIRATSKPAPSLKAGDTVMDQCEIVGPIAHGGLNWIYLAIDCNVSDRWVVLKSMMTTKNEKDFAVVQAEREFLTEASHPGIVKIINFTDETNTNSATDFIVMEYVGGPSLRRQRRSYPDGITPCDPVIGYVLELFPALDYLRSRGVVYNDLKPDNVLLSGDHVAFIDVDTVTDIGTYGHIYGTPGFQAPEIATMGPAIASGIYTVGHTLTSLILKLPATSGIYDPGLPSPTEEPPLHCFYSLYHFLLRACRESPEVRFGSAEEMSVRLIGVLRGILAIRDGVQFPQTVSNFSPQRSMYGIKHLVFRTGQLVDGITRGVEITSQEVTFALPVPLVDPTSPSARVLSTLSFTKPNELIKTLTNALSEPGYGPSMEIPLDIVRAKLGLGLIDEARDSLCDVSERSRRDWRYHWCEGVTYLFLGQFNDALASFHHVLTMLSGELAPKLALTAIPELIQQRLGIANASLLELAVARVTADLSNALDNVAVDTPGIFSPARASGPLSPQTIRFNTLCLYTIVWAANLTTVSSAFGLARQLASKRQHEMAIFQLDRVPGSSHYHRMTYSTTVLMLTSGMSSGLAESRIRRAARRLMELPTSEPRMPQLRIAVMVSALSWLHSSSLDHATNSNGLFGAPFTVTGPYEGLKKDLQMLARSPQFPRHRYSLVDITNLIRPRA